MNPDIQAFTDIIIPIAVSVLVGAFSWLTSILIDALKPYMNERLRAKTKGTITEVTVVIITGLIGFIPTVISWAMEADSGGWAALVITAVVVAKGRHLSGKVNNKETRPAITDTLLDLSVYLSELPSDDPNRLYYESIRDSMLDRMLPEIKAEAGFYAEQAKGEEVNEGN